MIHGEQPFCNISNELERFELWKYQFGLSTWSCVCQGRECLAVGQAAAGSSGLCCGRGAGGIRGVWVAAPPS